MFIEKLTKEQVLALEIPTGKPLFYNFIKGKSGNAFKFSKV
jgi:bisphosphoglycerate-dependent phosphoglycerate mutase